MYCILCLIEVSSVQSVLLWAELISANYPFLLQFLKIIPNLLKSLDREYQQNFFSFIGLTKAFKAILKAFKTQMYVAISIARLSSKDNFSFCIL